MNTALYCTLHFLVDMVCAWAMFAFFRAGSYENLLIYNFCAFALQMPLGTLLDLFRDKIRRLPALCAAIGAILTAAGAMLHPALLGLGNALFHVGGGMDVIEEDFAKRWKGRALGAFVAPGAIGLYLGTVLGKRTASAAVLLIAIAAMAVLLFLLLRAKGYERQVQTEEPRKTGMAVLALCCFLVVILRSWVGLAVSFPWKAQYAALAVLAAALGKLCGGLLAARFGIMKTAAASLILAAICYIVGDIPAFGLSAVLLFNMSMPLTLYLLASNLPRLPGFAFGLLTFGLFLGFLPVYAGMELPISGAVFGAVGSLISLALLTAAGKAAKYGKISA